MSNDYVMKFDIGTIKHLGLQMYSTLPPIIAELVSNAWDADATRVDIQIPTGPMNNQSTIVVTDNGLGMTDTMVRNAYLVVGRDKRAESGTDLSEKKRKVMGRKGIGKFSGFGIAAELEIESVREGEISRFVMNYEDLKSSASKMEIKMPALPPSGEVASGTRVTLRNITKYKTRSVDIANIKRNLARRFSVIGSKYDFSVYINGEEIGVEDRDLKRLLDKDADGNAYLWEFNNLEIRPGTGWKISGWIGALDRTREVEDSIQRGIAVMARGKLVQEPFVFDAVVGQQFALSYLIGELHAEFVDEGEDTVGTTRNSLVWDGEANQAFKEWGQKEVNKIARSWSTRRMKDNEAELDKNALYQDFKQQAAAIGNSRALKVADKLIREVVRKNPIATSADQEPVITMCLDFLEFDAFWELAQDLSEASIEKPERLVELFREWEVIEAKEMLKVTKGRIATVEKLQHLLNTNALEVPTLHTFLKEFPWVIDPRWTLISDEKKYSQMLNEQFPEEELLENDKRIDFICVGEGDTLVIVEIKRPLSRISMKELAQVEEYVAFMRDLVERTTDPELRHKEVIGYILCGSSVDTYQVRQKIKNLDNAKIYVRFYSRLLSMVQKIHSEFIDKYDSLQSSKVKKLSLSNVIEPESAPETA